MDALGSVTGTVNSACQVVNTYRYKPYGSLLSKTGVGADPAFGWVEINGYKQTQKKFSDFYVRARHYDFAIARWATADPSKNKRYAQVLANAMTCLSESESSLDPFCHGNYRSDRDSRCNPF